MGLGETDLLGKSVRLQQLSNIAQARSWWRFTLLGLVALVWLARPTELRASCGYYVVIGHPSAEAATEQARMRHEQIPGEPNKAPCDGPQCRGQNYPIAPAPPVNVASQDQMAMALTGSDCDEVSIGFGLIDQFSFLSDPHIWRIDPPPRF